MLTIRRFNGQIDGCIQITWALKGLDLCLKRFVDLPIHLEIADM